MRILGDVSVVLTPGSSLGGGRGGWVVVVVLFLCPEDPSWVGGRVEVQTSDSNREGEGSGGSPVDPGFRV